MLGIVAVLAIWRGACLCRRHIHMQFWGIQKQAYARIRMGKLCEVVVNLPKNDVLVKESVPNEQLSL